MPEQAESDNDALDTPSDMFVFDDRIKTMDLRLLNKTFLFEMVNWSLLGGCLRVHVLLMRQPKSIFNVWHIFKLGLSAATGVYLMIRLYKLQFVRTHFISKLNIALADFGMQYDDWLGVYYYE